MAKHIRMQKIITRLDTFLNTITMYRLVLYSLVILAIQSLLCSVAGLISFSPLNLLATLAILLVSCVVVNTFWSKILRIAVNRESALITAFILFFIFAPLAQLSDAPQLFLAGALAMSAKYVFAFHKKHLFNPAAISAVIMGIVLNAGVTWWVGTLVLIPSTAVLGLLLLRRTRRFSLFGSFAATAVVTILGLGLLRGQNVMDLLSQLVTSWPIFFFGCIMLTEPLTMPPTSRLRLMFGVLIGLLFGSQTHLGPVYSSPELALVIGNIFAFFVSPKDKISLTLVKSELLAPNICEVTFRPDRKVHFEAGQYLELTLAHQQPDSRGIRRYFTMTSSPTDPDLRIAFKFYDQSSTYKRALLAMKVGESTVASPVIGDFTLPTDSAAKLVFIAGGIGVTPFRSILQYLIDLQQTRDIVLIYASHSPAEFVYQDFLAKAVQKLGIKVIYTIIDQMAVPANWTGQVGRITPEMITTLIPDFKLRGYYFSGPPAMIANFTQVVTGLGVSRTQIKSDAFSGYPVNEPVAKKV